LCGDKGRQPEGVVRRCWGMDRNHRELTERILACAFDVHTRLGPGLLESTYRTCMVHRLRREGIAVESEVPVKIEFDGIVIGTAYRADLVVEGKVLIELKAVDNLLSVHLAQLRTYLEHSRLPVGLLLNFNVKSLKEGIRRLDLDAGQSRRTHSSTPPNSFFPA
jgi:GxxExxY protein